MQGDQFFQTEVKNFFGLRIFRGKIFFCGWAKGNRTSDLFFFLQYITVNRHIKNNKKQ